MENNIEVMPVNRRASLLTRSCNHPMAGAFLIAPGFILGGLLFYEGLFSFVYLILENQLEISPLQEADLEDELNYKLVITSLKSMLFTLFFLTYLLHFEKKNLIITIGVFSGINFISALLTGICAFLRESLYNLEDAPSQKKAFSIYLAGMGFYYISQILNGMVIFALAVISMRELMSESRLVTPLRSSTRLAVTPPPAPPLPLAEQLSFEEQQPLLETRNSRYSTLS